jgi:alpha-L-rhamnosidase
MTGAPYDLSIDSGGDQFPVAGGSPRLSWKIPPSAADVAGYELQARVEGAALESAVVAGHLFVPWPWAALRSRQRVEWRVRWMGRRERSEWSSWHGFEVGLLAEDWQASWISPVEAEDAWDGKRPAYRLSGAFDVPSEVVRARLYTTALGVYEAFVNGERVGTAELSPGSTSYDQTLYAQACDVTSSVRRGANDIVVVLSDGWFRGQFGAFRIRALWGDVLGARAELHLEFADGSTEVIRSGTGWTSARSNIARASLMAGQVTDFTLDPEIEKPAVVDQVAAPAVEWSPAPPVRIVESLRPVSVQRVAENAWVADFGQNASGWLTLTDLGPTGTRTVIDYGEWVGPNGDLDTSHLDSSRPGEPPIRFLQRDEVVSGGADDVFMPRHTVHGFQYARIQRDGGDLEPGAVTMQVVHTDLRRTGSFECSDGDLNRLHHIADWSFRGNAVDVPTDCPTRERLGWTGDYQVFAPTATRLYDVLGFSRKWLRSVRDDQLPDGRIANYSPDGRRLKHHLDDQFAMMTGSAGWGDAIVAVPWELYQSYGDREVLSENWDAMVRWVDWASGNARTARHHSRVQRSTEPLPHEQYLWDGSFHWGEWTEPMAKGPDGKRINPIQTNPMAWFTADKGEVGTAYLFRSTLTLSRVADVLGLEDHAARYRATAERIRDAWRTEFLRPDGRTVGDTQAAYVRALNFGLIPSDLHGAAADRLVELVRAAGLHLSTGFLATGDLLPVLCDTGHADVAYALLLQRTPPSWLYMVERGATTIWEDWEGIDLDGQAHESLNHYSKGVVVRFMHTHTLGLQQDEGSVGWRSFTVAPVPGPDMEWARGGLESPQGRIAVEWRATGEDFTVTVEVPAGSTATLVFPDGVREILPPGSATRTRRLPATAVLREVSPAGA